MPSMKVLALGAFAGFAAAQTCSKDVEISQPTQVLDCEVVDADVTVSEDLAGAVTIDGPSEIRGSLIVRNVTGLLSLTSNTLESIEGTFELNNCESLNSIQMDSLRSIDTLKMNRLTDLQSLIFGTEGVTKASTVDISDTHIDNLDGFKLATVDSLVINNNGRLISFESDLVNITEKLIIDNNGNNFEIKMPKLETAKEIQIRSSKSFEVPLLESVTGSLILDDNKQLKSFSAPNLTMVTNSVSFINNTQLANVSLPLLEEISGDLTVLNNEKLVEVDGFPKVETVRGAIFLGGNFDSVEMPALKDVKGSVNVTSTTDISDFCDFFDEAAEDGRIQGEASCKSDNADALEGGEGGEENGSSGGGNDDSDSDSSEGDDDSAAGVFSVNFAVLGLALVAGVAQLL